MDAYMTVTEAAETIGVGRSTIYRLLQLGVIPGRRTYGYRLTMPRWEIDRAGFDEWRVSQEARTP